MQGAPGEYVTLSLKKFMIASFRNLEEDLDDLLRMSWVRLRSR
ncbi:MAG: hypothetical protein ABI806_28390 [Candidatus Solibacter sp.]